MSRSFKHSPFCLDGKNGKTIPKRYANKAVRNYQYPIKNGKSYKKIFCSYNIHDFVSRWSWEEARKEFLSEPKRYKNIYKCSTLKDFYKFWSKYYRRK